MASIFGRLIGWFRSLLAGPRPRKVIFFEGDELPDEMFGYDLAVASEHGTLWEAGMLCPCGCHEQLRLMLLKDVKPRWDLTVDKRGRATLYPSVWRSSGCRSHFWLTAGQVKWCAPTPERWT